MRFPLACLAATVLLSAPLVAQVDSSLKAVLAQPIDRIQTTDFRAEGHLIRVDAKGARTSYPVTLKAHWFSGVLRILCLIGGPADSRVHLLLEMRPDGHNSIQVAHPGDKAPAALPFEKWNDGPLGPGFSYEDFFESQYYWPTQSLQPGKKFGARLCDLLKSKPGPSDRTHYAEMQTWLDHSIGYPVYVEKTIKATGTVKEFTYFGLRKNSGVWSASQVESKIRGQAGSTLLVIDRGSPKANLSPRDFAPEQLTRF
ncbi:MAG TPA: outer membrane lipoprotein-sorting protein [Acidobacteriaceae bacterium]|jgi:hypothetical protein|nr:outer membrane lipoprotein-sorting protein [Acidobacteriaceae bacterium]